MQQKKTYCPATTIISFDLHGVVCRSDYRAILKIGLGNPNSLLRLAMYAFNPLFLKDVWRLWRSHAVAAAYLQLVCTKHRFLASTVPFLIKVGNAQKPNHLLISFIKQLKNHGYAVHLFSNIGDIILDDFAVQYPQIIALFDTICATSKTTDYIGKPYDDAFAAYQTNCNPSNKQVIFIDNTKRNIAAAHRHNMTGILYGSTTEVIKQLSAMLAL
jgi:FMN phosphatase YigB (HAD superfamily)